MPRAAPVARPSGEGGQAPALAVGVTNGREASSLAALARLAVGVPKVPRKALVTPRPPEPLPADAGARVLVAYLGSGADTVTAAN